MTPLHFLQFGLFLPLLERGLEVHTESVVDHAVATHLARRRQAGMSQNPITETEFDAYCRRRGVTPRIWEGDVFMRLDDAYLAALSNKGDAIDDDPSDVSAPLKDPKKVLVTRYQGIDPGGSKNWVLVWVAVDKNDDWWAFAEWPDFDEWAIPGNNVEGKAGPAQKSLGYGIKDYVELIREVEKETGGEAYERL